MLLIFFKLFHYRFSQSKMSTWLWIEDIAGKAENFLNQVSIYYFCHYIPLSFISLYLRNFNCQTLYTYILTFTQIDQNTAAILVEQDVATTSKTSPSVSISENQSNQNKNTKIILAENFPHMVIQHRENESKYLSLFFI